MKKLIILFLSILIFSCSPTEPPESNPPQRVSLVPRSSDLAAIEKGIDAVPVFDAIQIQWHKLHDPDLSHYRVFRKGGNYNYFARIAEIDLETTSSQWDTTYLDIITVNEEEDPRFNYEYLYFVRAVKNGLESVNSDTAKYLLWQKSVLTYPPNTEPLDSLLSWQFPGDVDNPDSYILRIETDYPYLLHFARRLQPYPYGDNDQTLNLNQLENPPSFSTGIYRWRIDIVGTDSTASGSESNWRTFTYN